MPLVGFIIRIYHNAQLHERQIPYLPYYILLFSPSSGSAVHCTHWVLSSILSWHRNQLDVKQFSCEENFK